MKEYSPREKIKSKSYIKKIVEKIKISTIEIGSQASEKVQLWSKVNKEDLPVGPVVTKLPFSAEDVGLIPGLELSSHMPQGN